ncbi:hypothetical protein D3C71_1676310 [compost metagenome]
MQIRRDELGKSAGIARRGAGAAGRRAAVAAGEQDNRMGGYRGNVHPSVYAGNGSEGSHTRWRADRRRCACGGRAHGLRAADRIRLSGFSLQKFGANCRSGRRSAGEPVQ